MQTRFRLAPLALLVGCFAGTAYAQSNSIDVTLEVLDDVSDIDAVVVRLEDERESEQQRDDQLADERERDSFSGEVRAADAEQDNRERDEATDRDERRELENDEEDLESDLERTLDDAESDTAAADLPR